MWDAGKLHQDHQHQQVGYQGDHGVAHRDPHVIDALEDAVGQGGQAIENDGRGADKEHHGRRLVRIPVQEIENRAAQGRQSKGAGNADQHHHADGVLGLSPHRSRSFSMRALVRAGMTEADRAEATAMGTLVRSLYLPT